MGCESGTALDNFFIDVLRGAAKIGYGQNFHTPDAAIVGSGYAIRECKPGAVLPASDRSDAFVTLMEFLDQGGDPREFPNRIAPEGRMRRVDALQYAYEQGRKIMRSQRYQVQEKIEFGDDQLASSGQI